MKRFASLHIWWNLRMLMGMGRGGHLKPGGKSGKGKAPLTGLTLLSRPTREYTISMVQRAAMVFITSLIR